MTLKKFALLLLTAVTVLLLAGCGEAEGESKPSVGNKITLNVYNWGEYISDGFQGSLDSNAAFEEYFNEHLAEKYGYYIEVNYSTYATNEDMYSKITSGAGIYDVIVPSDYMIDKLAKEGWLYAFDASTLPNYGNIYDSFKNKPYYDPENLYSVPYTYGMVGVIYNTALVDEEDYAEESWGLLWNEKYKGKILQFNNQRDAFGSAMYYLGLDVNTTDEAVWRQAQEKLSEQKPLVQGYVNDEIFNKMTTASAAVAPYFVGDYIIMADQNEDLDFFFPKEGTNYYVDAMCIPANSTHKDAAKEYINFMLSEEVAIANAIYIGYASPNRLVAESEEYAEEMGEYAMDLLYGVTPEQINGDYNALYGTASYQSFDPATQALVNELWVHISCGVIVAGVLSVAIYNTYIKKKRSRDYRLRDKSAIKIPKNVN